MLIDQLGDDVLSPDHAHVLDGARVVDVPDTERPDVWIDDGGGGEDECAGHCDELEEAAAEGLSQLGEAEVVEVRGVERLEIDVNCTGDLMKTSKTKLNLRRLEQDNGL